jgi:iron-sulfur cluster assembly protein
VTLITVTEAALTELVRVAKDEGKDPRVRIAIKGGGCSGFTVDMDFTKYPADEEYDEVFSINGIEFIVDDKSALFVKDATLDFGGGLLDRGFKWEFPQASGGCGCGVSFSF